MNLYFTEVKISSDFVNKVNTSDKDDINQIFKESLLPVIEDKLDKKINFEINPSNIEEFDFSLIICLNDKNYYTSKNIIFWIPVDDENITDYNILKNSNDINLLADIFKKYNITYWNRETMIQIRNEIIDNPLFEGISSGVSHKDMKIPFYQTLENGNGFIISKKVTFSKIKKLSYENDDKILYIGLNVSSEDFYKKIKYVSLSEDIKNPLAFIISCKGEYNEKNFNKYFLSLEEINFDKYYEIIKKELNIRYRETLNDSIILEKNTNFSNKLKEIKILKIKEKDKLLIKNYFQNYSNRDDESFDFIHNEKIENTWEEYDTDDVYDEITYFNCKVWISMLIYQ